MVFDIMFNKAGTEAITESFYRVMEAQKMDEGQSFVSFKDFQICRTFKRFTKSSK